MEYFAHPWVLGIRKCKEFIFTGDYINAEEAWRVGMVNRVVPREKLEEETLNLAKKIALQSSISLRFAKMTINDTQDMMGFRSSLASHFKVHHLVHCYTALEADEVERRQARKEAGVKGFLKTRDKKFEKQG